MSESNGNGRPLREMSGFASKPPRMSLEDAKAMLRQGVSFCDVLQQIDPVDEVALREFFTTDDLVTANRRHAYQKARAKPIDPTYDACNRCGGIVVQTGSCRTCQSCGENEGCG